MQETNKLNEEKVEGSAQKTSSMQSKCKFCSRDEVEICRTCYKIGLMMSEGTNESILKLILERLITLENKVNELVIQSKLKTINGRRKK